MVAACAWLIIATGACTTFGPDVLPPASPTVAPVATPPAVEPVASPTFALRRLAPDDLLSPADLTFGGAFPEPGWQRCDDYATYRSLEKFHRGYKVASSLATVWQYGSACDSADQTARVDQYAWQAESRPAAWEVSDGVYMGSYLQNLEPEKKSQIRQLKTGATSVGTLAVNSPGGKPQYIAEIVGLEGPIVVYMRILTAVPLSDEEYLRIVDAFLGRVGKGDGAK